MRITELVVVYDVGCPRCSRIARELPDVVRVPVTVRSCRDPQLAVAHPDVPASVRACARPAIGTRRPDGSVRWWPGLPGAVAAILPVLRPSGVRDAAELLWTALRRPPGSRVARWDRRGRAGGGGRDTAGPQG